eukprot:symbB.v1.2.027914.t2/scaffold2898.1/size67682/3
MAGCICDEMGVTGSSKEEVCLLFEVNWIVSTGQHEVGAIVEPGRIACRTAAWPSANPEAMSDTSWGCQSVEECAVPTWDHALGHFLVGGCMWLVFVFLGVCWTSLAPFIDFDFRNAFGRYQYGLASAGLGAGLCLAGIYMMQCLTYLHRSIVGFVDPLLHAFEMLGTLISLLDICARWAYMCCDGFWQVSGFGGTFCVFFCDWLLAAS